MARVQATAQPFHPTTSRGRIPPPAQRTQLPIGALVQACRPRQWIKNALVGLAPAAAGELTRGPVVNRLVATFAAFCLLSSATYLLNDVRDRHQDRLHPKKRRRPIASGRLQPGTALRAAGVLATSALLVCLLLGPMVALIAVCYLILTTSYSIVWRQLVVVDLLVVAAGFVLRVGAGAAATGVTLPVSLTAVTMALALFLVTGKRYAEFLVRGTGGATRATLARYSAGLLRAVLACSAAVGCVAYLHWAFVDTGLDRLLELSTVPFVLCIGRYARAIRGGAGEAPDEVILGDPVLLALAGTWAALFVAGVYGGA
jgi:decaprenyl-phosphate phosphoribosyltransferase